MKMVAAAKLRKAQDRMIQLRPYAGKLQEIIGNVVSAVNVEDIPSRLVEAREVENVLFIVVTSNRGLCGPFNTNIIKHANQYMQQHYADALKQGRLQVMCIGRKAHDFYKKRGYKIFGGKNFDVFADLNFDVVNAATEQVFESFLSGEVDKVHLCYNEFKNVMSQIRQVEDFLPLAPNKIEETETESKQVADYIFEPDREQILIDLIPKALRIQMFRAVLESNASEQGARMVAMDTATENAEELLKALKISYNKARQAAITKEILEISAGADALSA